MNKTSNTLLAMTVAFTKRYLRDKVALFFTVVFPLVFLVIFGGIFGGDDGPNFDLAVINNANTEFASNFEMQMDESELFTISEVEDFADAEERIGRGSLDAIVQFPENFGNPDELGRPSGELEIIFDQSDEQLSIVNSMNCARQTINSAVGWTRSAKNATIE